MRVSGIPPIAARIRFSTSCRRASLMFGTDSIILLRFICSPVAGTQPSIVSHKRQRYNGNRLMKTRSLILLFITLLSLSCREDKKEGGAKPVTPLVILLATGPTNYDPQVPFDDSDYVLANIYEPLVRFDSAFRLSPGLAHRWTNPDDHTWRFYLKEDATFSDGTPLHASDVKFSIERMQKLAGSDRQGFTEHIASINVVDAHTIDVKTDSPLIILNNLVYIPILSEKDVNAKKTPPFLGTGPYLLKSHDATKVVLERNPHRKPAPSISEVQYLISLDREKIFQDIEQIKPDLVITVPFRKIEDFLKLKRENKMEGFDIQSAKGISVFYLIFNMKESVADMPDGNPLRDASLRKAFAHATNKEELVKVVLKGFGRPANQLIAPEIFGFDTGTSAPEYDLAAAKKILEETGHSGIKIPIYGSESGTNIMEKTLIKQWEQAGIHAELKRLPDDEYARRLVDGSMALTYAGYSCGSGDASELLTFGLHTRGTDQKYGKGNYAFYSNREVDQVCQENLRVFDPKERLDMLQRSLRIVNDDLPYLPLVIFNDVYIVSDRLQWQPAVN